jgi:hypothetical protein
MISRMVIIACFVGLIATATLNIATAAPNTVIATSGTHQLTDGMLDEAIDFGQFLVGRQFSATDAATMREGLISTFRMQPDKEVAGYQALAQFVPALRSTRSSLAVAKAREGAWAAFAKDPTGYRAFQNDPAGQILLRYNPVIVNAGGMIITRLSVESLFASNALVAKIAGLAPPSQTDIDECLRLLPSQFASLTKEQQEFFRQAESRLARFQEMYASHFIGPSVVSEIKKTVRSPKEVPDRARALENTAFKYEAAVNRFTSNTDRFVTAWSRGFPRGAAAQTMMGQIGSWGK